MTDQNNQQTSASAVAKPADTSAHTGRKWAVGILIFLGVILRWIYAVAVDVIRNQSPWCFGSWTSILIRLAVALGVTFFV